MKDLEGFDSLERSLNYLAKEIPKTSLTKAVKKGAPMVLSTIKSAAPKKSNTLREGLILHRERSRSKDKVVYDVMPDPEKNVIFQKPIKNPVRSTSPYAYYPASMEYGFFTRRPDGGMTYTRGDGDTMNIDKVPGKHFMRVGVEVSGEAAKKAIAGSLLADIVKEFGD